MLTGVDGALVSSPGRPHVPPRGLKIMPMSRASCTEIQSDWSEVEDLALLFLKLPKQF